MWTLERIITVLITPKNLARKLMTSSPSEDLQRIRRIVGMEMRDSSRRSRVAVN